MAKKWVHPEMRQAVQARYLQLCAQIPDVKNENTDNLWNIAKEQVEFPIKVASINFSVKYGLTEAYRK